MKALLLCCFVFIFFAFHTNAQVNLVPNPSFEDTVHCPDNISQWYNCALWVNPNGAGPDYFNACANSSTFVSVPNSAFGYQPTVTGEAYVGLYLYQKTTSAGPFDYREYMEIMLTDTLKSGKNYDISFYVNYATLSNIAIDNIGLFISNNSISNPTPTVFNYTPQIISPTGLFLRDTLNWYKVQGTYTAAGGERYITIGNFKDANSTDTIHTDPFSASSAYYYIDDVNVSLLDTSGTGISEHTDDLFFTLFPNPSNGSINLHYTLKANENGMMLVYDLAGKKVRAYELPGNASDLYINGNPLESGVYFYQIKVNGLVVKSDKLIIIK